jgi:integrase
MAARMVKTNTPGIYKRGSRYVVVWLHRGRQRKQSFRTYAEAREAKGKRDSGDRRPPTRIGFEVYFEQWIGAYAGRTARGFADTSRALYRRSITDHALPVWRTWKLADVEPTDVRELFAALRDVGTSPSALKGLRAALSAMFATAVEDGMLRSNPVQGVRIPAAGEEPEQDRAKALTRAELALLLAALPAEWRLFFEFLAHTGLRISEAIALRWEHLDLGERPRVFVREQCHERGRKRLKSRQGRRDIPLSAGMRDRLLARRRDSYRGEDAPVFATATGTGLSRPNLAGRVLKPAAKAVGLTVEVDGQPVPWPSFHRFRHTCASLLFEAGKNVRQVSEWLGHADPAFTLRTYVHLMDDGLGSADFLDQAVTAPGGGNEVATTHPQTAANGAAPRRRGSGDSRQNRKNRKRP